MVKGVVQKNGRFPARLTEVLSSRHHGLPDDLVGLEEEGRGNGDTQGLGGREVDDQLELHGLLHGEVGRFGTFQNLVHVVGGTAVLVGAVHPIGHEPARLHELPKPHPSSAAHAVSQSLQSGFVAYKAGDPLP